LTQLEVPAIALGAPSVIDLATVRARLVRCDPKRPLYRQLADMIREIETPDQDVRLPTERRFAQDLRMARVTVRKALADLERDGIIRRRQGAGTYLFTGEGAAERRISGQRVMPNRAEGSPV
jgi:DNA-binding FadR family transcriptional regulator